MSRLIPASNSIEKFLHCLECIRIIPAKKSPQEWAQIEVGFTEIGMQVWCKRHQINILHIDFEGAIHPANTSSQTDYKPENEHRGEIQHDN